MVRRCPQRRATDFPANERTDFLSEYLALVKKESPATEVANWLLDNARRITPAIFSRPSTIWKELLDDDVLALRAVSPADVFTLPRASVFLEKTQGSSLSHLVNVIFAADDLHMLENLPARLGSRRAPMAKLMHLAYERGIRPADPRV